MSEEVRSSKSGKTGLQYNQQAFKDELGDRPDYEELQAINLGQ